MSNKRRKEENKISTAAARFDCGFILVPAILIIPLVIGMAFGGTMPWKQNTYNSYLLQARAWLGGHLDLGRDYSYLEIAHFGGRHYISFPPFPSYVYLPFVVLFRSAFREGWIAVISYLAGGSAVYGIFRHFKTPRAASVIFAAAFCAGTNLLFLSVNAWVWFIAQNMCFTLSAGALYAALSDRRTLSLALISCAVGCRPFQILYFPLILYILFKNEKDKNGSVKLSAPLLLPLIAPLVIGGSYMALNYARFGNVFEFGHNYLPEFVNAEHGQFGTVYMKQNIYSLLRLPQIENGHIVFQKFNGFNMFLASPPLLLLPYCAVCGIKRGETRTLTLIALVSLAAELLCITMHKTMGGWHYGNRYTVDIIPLAAIICAAAHTKRTYLWALPPAILGAAGNLYWIFILD